MVFSLRYAEETKKKHKDQKAKQMARLRKGEVVKRRIEARDLALEIYIRRGALVAGCGRSRLGEVP